MTNQNCLNDVLNYINSTSSELVPYPDLPAVFNNSLIGSVFNAQK